MVADGRDSDSSAEREGPLDEARGKPRAEGELGAWQSTESFETISSTPDAKRDSSAETIDFPERVEESRAQGSETEAAPSLGSAATEPDDSVQPVDSPGAVGESRDRSSETEAASSMGSAATEPNNSAETIDYKKGKGRASDQTTLRSKDPESTLDSDEDGTIIARSGPPSIGSFSEEFRVDMVPGFTLLEKLGRGGMGIVYKAHQHHVNRMVALKMIRGDRTDNPSDIARFLIEAEAVGRLKHENIVQIYHIGMARTGPFFALELLEGGTLADQLGGVPQPVRETATLLATLAKAVDAAHAAGIIHRDLKPSNVLYSTEGIPKIADFGLAKRQEVDDGETRIGQVIGTPTYMSPEQAKGWDNEIGSAADIYSLGVILYEMLTGSPPLKGMNSDETIKLVREKEPVPPSKLRPNIPFDLETICLKCLDKDPNKRYASAGNLAEDLESFLDGHPIRARRTPLWERGFKLMRRRPLTSTIVVIGIVTAIGGAWGGLDALAKARDRAAREREQYIAQLQRFNGLLLKAQDDVHARRWDDAQINLVGLLKEIGDDPRFDVPMKRADGLLGLARAGDAAKEAEAEAQAKLGRFLDARDEALFRDTRFDNLSPGDAAEAAIQAARAGLGVFGSVPPRPGSKSSDAWTLGPLPVSLTQRERDEISVGFHELLLVLADAIAQQPGAPKAQRAEEALSVLDRAVALRSPATQACRLRRAAYLAMKGDAEGARREREEARTVPPSDAFDFFLIGRELTRTTPGAGGVGRPDWTTAKRYLEDATRLRPDHFWARCLLAICYLQTNEPDKARLALDGCIEKKPKSVHLYLRRGLASAAIGRQLLRTGGSPATAAERARHFEDAEADFRAALKLLDDGNAPDDAALRYALLVNRGVTRFARDDFKAAEADLREAIRLDGNRFEAFSNLAQVLAKVDHRLGRTDEAIAHFTRAIALRPDWAPLYRGRAEVLLGLPQLYPDRLEAALRDLDEAIRRELAGSPAIAADRTNQAVLLHRAGRNEQALEACDAALALVPQYALAHRLRLELLLDLKRYDDLIRSCNVALESAKAPSASELYELRAMAYDARGEFSAASDDYTRALTQRPTDPQLLRRRGWSFLAAGGADGLAFKDFDRVTELAPKDPDGFVGRGYARARLRQHREAVADAEEAVRLGRSERRIIYNAARVYVQAAVAIVSDPRKATSETVRTVDRYQTRAVSLLKQAIAQTPAEQRVAFRETFQADPALKPIVRRLQTLNAAGVPDESQAARPSSPKAPAH